MNHRTRRIKNNTIYSMILYHINMMKYFYMTTPDNKVVLNETVASCGSTLRLQATFDSIGRILRPRWSSPSPGGAEWRIAHAGTPAAMKKTRLPVRYLLSTCNHGILVFWSIFWRCGKCTEVNSVAGIEVTFGNGCMMVHILYIASKLRCSPSG